MKSKERKFAVSYAVHIWYINITVIIQEFQIY